jgi:SRSO17 transposase
LQNLIFGTHSHFGSWRGKPPVAGAAEEIAQGLGSSAWRHLSAGEGTKGARLRSGYDAAKKTKGIKRNVIVDTIGLLLGITEPKHVRRLKF